MRTNAATADALDNAASFLNQVKETASAKLDEGAVKARRLLKKSEHLVEDVSDESVRCIRRHPVSSVAVSFAAGLALGFLVPRVFRRG